MKKIFLLHTLILSMAFLSDTATVTAQPVPPASIQDSVIGWMKIYKFKGVNQPLKVDDKLYSAAHLAICDSFANWIQASYLPKGGLGDVKKSVGEKLGLYNQHIAAKPPSYGAFAKTYTELKYNSSRKLEPFTNSHVFWSITANLIPGDWPVREICTPTQYYFTMPSFESSEEGSVTSKKKYDLSAIPALKPYTTLWIKNMGFGGGKEAVLLSKNNQSPFVKLTKAEYLQAWEAAIPRYYEAEKKKIYEQNKGNQKSIDNFLKYLEEKKDRMTAGLQKNREKYRNRMEEPALANAQPSIHDLENGRDLFSNGYLTDAESTSDRLPVYKVDPAIAALCKKDKPQWILIQWEYNAGNPVEKYQHESILSNFNFGYVYDFFFDPEKVKGQPYKPLRSPAFKEAVVINEASEASKNNAKDKSIHFFEDFSTTPVGSKPIGWTSKLANNGTSSVVTRLDGLDGNWAVVASGYTILPNQFKKTLPPNFTLSYDVVAAQHFTWGAKGLRFQLAKETSPGNAESYLQLNLRPGYDGRDGEVTLETKFPSPPGYLNGSKWLTAPGFSNNKKNNLIKVTIKKSGETLLLYIDNIKIAEYEKAIPAAHLFNGMSFYTAGGDQEHDKYYISNIRITAN